MRLSLQIFLWTSEDFEADAQCSRAMFSDAAGYVSPLLRSRARPVTEAVVALGALRSVCSVLPYNCCT